MVERPVTLPDPLATCTWSDRLTVAVRAARGAAAALLAVRGLGGAKETGHEIGDQLKTGVDRAAEGWVLGFLEAAFPGDRILAEERFSLNGGAWTPATDYWVVDALDGTRSYVEGYPGFCVQVAWIQSGKPRIGVIAEPIAKGLYVGAEGAGAFRIRDGAIERLVARAPGGPPRFVDSTRPAGVVGRWMDASQGAFVECGSVGLKIVRVAEGAADVYAKDFSFRLWDVAPGQVIAAEAGVRVGLWDGSPIAYDGDRIEWRALLATRGDDYDTAVSSLARSASSDS
jgi:fructose-1,6-bisphosphatase/inositol monophosphatase family enzyme